MCHTGYTSDKIFFLFYETAINIMEFKINFIFQGNVKIQDSVEKEIKTINICL